MTAILKEALTHYKGLLADAEAVECRIAHRVTTLRRCVEVLSRVAEYEEIDAEVGEVIVEAAAEGERAGLGTSSVFSCGFCRESVPFEMQVPHLRVHVRNLLGERNGTMSSDELALALGVSKMRAANLLTVEKRRPRRDHHHAEPGVLRGVE